MTKDIQNHVWLSKDNDFDPELGNWLMTDTVVSENQQ